MGYSDLGFDFFVSTLLTALVSTSVFLIYNSKTLHTILAGSSDMRILIARSNSKKGNTVEPTGRSQPNLNNISNPTLAESLGFI